MLKLGGLGVVFMVFFFVWTFIPGNAHDRLDRFCRPVEWTGNVFTSLGLLIWPTQANNVKETFEEIDYGCQYAVWRVIYEEEYIEELKAQGKIDENGNPIPDDEQPTNEEFNPNKPQDLSDPDNEFAPDSRDKAPPEAQRRQRSAPIVLTN